MGTDVEFKDDEKIVKEINAIYKNMRSMVEIKNQELTYIKNSLLTNFPEISENEKIIQTDNIEYLRNYNTLKTKYLVDNNNTILKYLQYLQQILKKHKIQFNTLKLKGFNEKIANITKYNNLSDVFPSENIKWLIKVKIIRVRNPAFYKVCKKCGHSYTGDYCNICGINYLFCPNCKPTHYLIHDVCPECKAKITQGKGSNPFVCPECGIDIKTNTCPQCKEKWYKLVPKFFLRVKNGDQDKDRITIKIVGTLASYFFDMNVWEIWQYRNKVSAFYQKIKNKKITFYGKCIYDKKNRRRILIAEPLPNRKKMY